jgi:Lysyl-tRNA synthetase (class I)
LNKYKGEKLAENWFPLKPLCKNCYNILTTKVISWEGEDVEYECNKCGYVGKSKINEGKLEWRAEWVALWYTFEVDVELYGKDHAAAGGSRDSCNELYEKLFNKMPPKGFAYEWISLVKDGKREPMGSSEGVSFDIDEWLRVGKPQALKYWYIVMKAKTHLDFDPSRTIPLIHEEYDKAERIYFNLEEPFAKDLKHDIIFSYIAANDFNPPKKIGLQIPYSLMAILVQILPKENKLEEMIRKLRRMKIINDGIDYEEERKLASYIEKVTYWVNKYAPANIKIKVQYEVPENIIKELMDNEVKMLKDVYNVIKNWEGEINKLETEIYNTIKANNIKPNQGFAILYKIILGKENGPRFVSLVQALEKDTILNILSKVFK